MPVRPCPHNTSAETSAQLADHCFCRMRKRATTSATPLRRTNRNGAEQLADARPVPRQGRVQRRLRTTHPTLECLLSDRDDGREDTRLPLLLSRRHRSGRSAAAPAMRQAEAEATIAGGAKLDAPGHSWIRKPPRCRDRTRPRALVREQRTDIGDAPGAAESRPLRLVLVRRLVALANVREQQAPDRHEEPRLNRATRV